MLGIPQAQLEVELEPGVEKMDSPRLLPITREEELQEAAEVM